MNTDLLVLETEVISYWKAAKTKYVFYYIKETLILKGVREVYSCVILCIFKRWSRWDSIAIYNEVIIYNVE